MHGAPPFCGAGFEQFLKGDGNTLLIVCKRQSDLTFVEHGSRFHMWMNTAIEPM